MKVKSGAPGVSKPVFLFSPSLSLSFFKPGNKTWQYAILCTCTKTKQKKANKKYELKKETEIHVLTNTSVAISNHSLVTLLETLALLLHLAVEQLETTAHVAQHTLCQLPFSPLWVVSFRPQSHSWLSIFRWQTTRNLTVRVIHPYQHHTLHYTMSLQHCKFGQQWSRGQTLTNDEWGKGWLTNCVWQQSLQVVIICL